MSQKGKALRAAIPHTIPVLMGYIFLGLAFGMLLQSKGFHFGWALLMSLTIYGGSMQFVSVQLLADAAPLWDVALIALMINIRQIFYGLTMLNTFRGMKGKKPYMIFSLTDETYSLLYSVKVPDGVDRNWFYLSMAMLNHSYWVVGSVLGALLGSMSLINPQGIDFSMTALFVVIFVDQWKSNSNHLSALSGVVLSAACLVLFGRDQFILPAVLSIVFLLLLLRKHLSKEEGRGEQ